MLTVQKLDTNLLFAIIEAITNGKVHPIRFRPYGAFLKKEIRDSDIKQ